MIVLLIGIFALIIGFAFQWSQLEKLRRKLDGAIFIQREGDRIYFLDGKGNKVSEKITINKSE